MPHYFVFTFGSRAARTKRATEDNYKDCTIRVASIVLYPRSQGINCFLRFRSFHLCELNPVRNDEKVKKKKKRSANLGKVGRRRV